MIIDDLYTKVLVNPILTRGVNKINIVSGYASATFANRHLIKNDDFKLNLIIGMPGRRSDHLGFLDLKKRFGDRFNGYYYNSRPPVHCKVYAWSKNEHPVIGYSGSANYSQPGFIKKFQVNQLAEENPIEIIKLYDELLPNCINITDYEFEGINSVISSEGRNVVEGSVDYGTILWEIPNVRVRISFLPSTGKMPAISGLNWGQRKGREPNQAYLPIRLDARKKGFLPEQAETFTLITDDNFSFDCVVAQQGRKAIHSTLDNSEIGRYVRKRIGVSNGDFVSLQNLIDYGRTDFTLEKINEETFLLDLSV